MEEAYSVLTKHGSGTASNPIEAGSRYAVPPEMCCRKDQDSSSVDGLQFEKRLRARCIGS